MSGNYQQDMAVMNRMQEMCEESLDPEHFEMWEEVKVTLFLNRNSLNPDTATEIEEDARKL
jgi:pterin-4a-carbinolamine dehydratase